jgi:hypothetical protein
MFARLAQQNSRQSETSFFRRRNRAETAEVHIPSRIWRCLPRESDGLPPKVMETAVTKMTLVAAAMLMVSGAFASAPASAEPAHGISPQDAALGVCASVNQYGPVQPVKVVEDGLGDWIVWLRDKDNDLWICNASAEGNVYASTLIRGDRLAGRGEEAIALMQVSLTPSTPPSTDKATQVCAAAGRKVDATHIVTTVEDGLGDYIVWMEGSDHTYWLCNASADAKLFVFQNVRSPINATSASAGFRAA